MPYRFDFRGTKHVLRPVIESQFIGVSGDELPVPIAIRLQRSPEGRLICTGLVVAPKPEEVTARALRGIPLQDLLVGLSMAIQGAVSKAERTKGGIVTGAGLSELLGVFAAISVEPGTVAVARAGPKGIPREHFERVAEAYRRALVEHPAAPVKALAEQWKVSPPTVRRWIRRARDMGLLGESMPGKAGEQPRQRRRPKRETT